MTTRFCFVFLFTLIIAIGCSGPDKLTVHQRESALKIDGNLSNWNTSESLIKSTDEIDYYAATYGNNLYLFIDVKSPLKNFAIRQSGLTVYLSNSEENKKRVGLAYPPGVLNLLREYPGAYEGFITELDWGSKPENKELVESLSKDLFSSVMIVERPDGNGDPDYGFIDKSQLEIDGFEIAAEENQRFITLEMKIPIEETSFFDLTKKTLWLGFSIEPPDFKYQDPNSTLEARQERYTSQGQTRRPSGASLRYTMRRNLGQSEDWFVINLQ